MTDRIDYAVVTAKGAAIQTFDTRKAAIAFAAARAADYPGLEVFEVIHRAPERRRIWRERAQLQLVCSQ